jgi:nicotinamide riboside transporter PnuC
MQNYKEISKQRYSPMTICFVLVINIDICSYSYWLKRGRKHSKMEKQYFFEKKQRKVWRFQKNFIPLQPQTKRMAP